jgi:phasin family protein
MAINNPYADAMKFWSSYQNPQVPNFDVNQAVSFGRRNAEALTAAGQCVSESVQAISRRQAELARAQVETLLKTSKDMLVNGSPEINTGKQVELAKTIFESSLNNLREVSELVTKSSFEVFDVLNKRASESIEEITSYAPTTSSKKKSA